MNKNRIRGLPGRTSERVIAKSRAIKGRKGKSGGDAAKAVGLTSGGLRRVRKSRTERVRKALAAKTASSAHGPWRVSLSPALCIALPNAFFDRLGLASVAAGHAA